MMVLYGYWPQLYGTVRCYTADGRTILSSAADTSRGKKPEAFAPKSTYNLERVAIQDGYHDKDIL